jgi:predicted dehydrogenase
MKTAVILGCGKRTGTKEGFAIGHAHARGYRAAVPDVELYAVDPDADNLRAFAEQFQLPAARLFSSTQALYAAVSPEMVSICTWPALHRPQVIEAVQAGVKGIICEKPMALDGSEIGEMLAACDKRGVKLAIAHQRCYEPAYIKAREIMRSGVLGENMTVDGRVGDGWDILSWTVHWFDMAAWLLDARPVSVLAGVDHNGTRRYSHAVEDSSIVHVEYDNGSQATFCTGPQVAGGAMMSVRGTGGMLHISGSGVRVWSREGYREIPVDGSLGYHVLMREMFDAVERNTPIACDAHRTADATRVAFAAHESARLQKRIALPATTRFAPLEILQHPPKRPRAAGHAVLVADAHHFEAAIGLSGRDGVISAIHAVGVEKLTVIDAGTRELTPADLADADLLLIYHTRRTSTPAEREAVSGWVKAGRPLAILHCGIGAYADWQQYRQWCGLYWIWHDEGAPVRSGHPHEPCQINIDDSTFAVPWEEAWLPRDEVYIRLGQGDPVDLLGTARLPDGQAWPMAWRNQKQRNIAVLAPGHRYDVWQLPVMHDALRAIIGLVSEG